MNNKLSKIKCIVVFGAGISAASMAHANWSITGLGTLGGRSSVATGINDSGQVVGESYTASGLRHAFITGLNGTGMTDLGTLGGNMSYATDINNSGQVVGGSITARGDFFAFITGPNGVGMINLGTLDTKDGSFSGATGINNFGQVVGYASTTNGLSHAFITGPNGVGMTDLGTLGENNSSSAFGINDSGQVVGSTNSGIGHAFITGPNGIGMTDLGAFGGNYSIAYGINNSGQVFGSYFYGDGAYGGASIVDPMTLFVTGPNGVGETDLGALDGYVNSPDPDNPWTYIIHNKSAPVGLTDLTVGGGFSTVASINNSGDIVGTARMLSGENHLFLLSHGKMTDLSILVDSTISPGWSNLIASDINNNGQIVGSGIHNGKTEAFLLSYIPAIPEPETYTMLLAGLGLLGFMARRRKESVV